MDRKCGALVRVCARGLRRFETPLVALAILAAVPAGSFGQVIYSVTDLGNLAGFSFPAPKAINNRGQVAGGTNTADFSVSHAFRTSPNSPINPLTDDLGLLPGSTSIAASGINNLGQVAGTATGYADFSGRGFRADPGNPTLVDLGVSSGMLSGLASSNANGINDAGQVTGEMTVATPPFCLGFASHAYRTQPNGPISTADDLGTLLVNNCRDSVGYSINSQGAVTGWSTSSAAGVIQSVFVANPGQPMQDVGGLGGPLRFPAAINSSGQVVGSSDLGSNAPFFSEFNAFLVSPGSPIQDIGTLGGSGSNAAGINKLGQIVGNSTTPGDTAIHAFLYQNGSMYDLNNLIPAGSGWVLQNATAINDFGQITGTGLLNGVFSAFRLDPMVSPGTLPRTGNDCNGTYRGTFNQQVTIRTGQTCTFLAGSVLQSGVKVAQGGQLFLQFATVLAGLSSDGGDVTLEQTEVDGPVNLEDTDSTIVDVIFVGNVTVDGGSTSIDPTRIAGNLSIKNLTGSAVNQVCGTKVQGNVQISGNAAPVMLGQGGACGGNTVLGGVQVQNNTAPVAVVGNTVSGNLACSGNSAITGSGNTVTGHKQGQCAGF